MNNVFQHGRYFSFKNEGEIAHPNQKENLNEKCRVRCVSGCDKNLRVFCPSNCFDRYLEMTITEINLTCVFLHSLQVHAFQLDV